MALHSIPVRPGNLREVAEQIERATGLRVEIVGGTLMMSPTPRGKHAGIVRRLRLQLEPRLPGSLGAYEVSSVAMPGDDDDYVTPDLAVLPVEWDEAETWIADPDDVALAVEVNSRPGDGKEDWYSRAGVERLLVVDPGKGVWRLLALPDRAGEWGDVTEGHFGDDIELGVFDARLSTDGLPRYDR